MPVIRPYRQVDENDCINGFFAYSGAVPVTAGTFVKIVSGYAADIHSAIVGDAGFVPTNAVSPRWGVPAKVTAVNSSGDAAVGMLLYDVREVDENGEKLVYNPRKAIENNWVISGCGVNIATKGLFMFSGVYGTPTAGAAAYLANDGNITTTGGSTTTATRVGKFLGPVDSNGFVLFKLEL